MASKGHIKLAGIVAIKRDLSIYMLTHTVSFNMTLNLSLSDKFEQFEKLVFLFFILSYYFSLYLDCQGCLSANYLTH